MNANIEKILNSSSSDSEKLKMLNEFKDEILKEVSFATSVVTGKYCYCKECKEYYLSKSFFIEETEVKTSICTYSDPINSGGNEFAPGRIISTYQVCPKGHRKLLDSREELD